MSVPRWIVVDDTDPDIQYDGPWFYDPTGSQNALGNYGPVYQNTLHGATLNAGLSYHFSGSQVKVYGTNNLRNDSGVLDPSWECFVDGISIGATSPFQFPENNWPFCGQYTLVDGPHVLTVNATVRKAQTFWFDQISYVPSLTVPLDDKAISIDNADPQLVQTAYGSGWVTLGGSANMTEQMSSVFTFDFTGVSLSWYGFIPTALPNGPSAGSYSVDQGTAVNFPLEGLPASSPNVYNQKFFQTANLTQGKHQIVIVFDGNNQTTPLVLDYIIVQNGSTPVETTTSIGSSTSTNSFSPISSNHTSAMNNKGIIVGGVIGGLVLITLTILSIFCIRRRHKQIWPKENNISSALEPQPFVYSPVLVMNSKSALDSSHATPQPHPQQSNPGRTGNTGYGGRKMNSGFNLTTANQVTDPPSAAALAPSNVDALRHHPAPGLIQPFNLPISIRPMSSARSEKLRREAEATAAALRPQRLNDGVLPSPPSSDSSASNPSNVLMHEDGDVQLLGDPAETNQEILPQYTIT